MTNIVPFPKSRSSMNSRDDFSRDGGYPYDCTPYDFTTEELERLFRWYSAMKFAFPGMQGVMTVCHDRRLSAIGLYGHKGSGPGCIITKHEHQGKTWLLWATDQDPPSRIASIRDLTERQIGAIDPPGNESAWLDLAGWTAIFTGRTTIGKLHVG